MTKKEKTYLVKQSEFENPNSSKDLSLDHKFEFYNLIDELASGTKSPEFTLWASTILKEMGERFPLQPVPKSILNLQKEFLKIKPLVDRYAVLYFSLSQVSLEGLNLEFGVWTGDSLLHMAKSFPDKTFYGFDAFDEIELKPARSNIVLVEGRFEETISKWKKEINQSISFMHIDADLYEPCRLALFELNDLIIPGTIIQFDELLDFNTKLEIEWLEGEWKALYEWSENFDRKFEPLSRDNTCRASIRVLV